MINRIFKSQAILDRIKVEITTVPRSRNNNVQILKKYSYKNEGIFSRKISYMSALLCLCSGFISLLLSSSYAFAQQQQTVDQNLNVPQSRSYIGAGNSNFGNSGYGSNTNDLIFSDASYDPFNPTDEARPAWAQGAYQTVEFNKLQPFGAELFKGNFAGTYQSEINPDYRVSSGDRIVVRMWGAKTYDEILTVDLQGNIFIPEIGPIYVLGTSANSLVSTIKYAVSKVFTNNIELYVNLQSSQPVAIFVTGAVNNPGRYAGSQNDNILSYIDRAGGINSLLGSYRTIAIKRNGEIIKMIDLYKFLVHGELPLFTLKNDDVIIVANKYLSISAYGLIKKPATYEFTRLSHTGQELLELSPIGANVTHVQVSGIKNGISFNKYLSVKEFLSYEFNPDDRVMFIADLPKETILTSVIGSFNGKSRFIVSKGTHLKDVLRNIHIDPNIADFSSLYIRRASVAEQQKIIIDESLKRLEQSALVAESGSVDEANIRVKEAELIQDFVKRAQAVKPDGVVVVSSHGNIRDLILEDQDEIIIPQKSDVIQIGGEVMMPKAVIYDDHFSILDYINESGGFSQRADQKNILLILPNGQVGKVEQLAIQPGARIVVMPKVDSKNMQFAKDVMQIIYQLAVATKVVVGL